MGLSAINIASSQISSSFNYSSDLAAQPDIQFFTAPTNASLLSVLQRQSNVKAAQAEGYAPTRWKIPTGHFSISVIGVEDFNSVQINKFELLEGSLPGPHQILLESSDRSIDNVRVGDTIQVDA